MRAASRLVSKPADAPGIVLLVRLDSASRRMPPGEGARNARPSESPNRQVERFPHVASAECRPSLHPNAGRSRQTPVRTTRDREVAASRPACTQGGARLGTVLYRTGRDEVGDVVWRPWSVVRSTLHVSQLKRRRDESRRGTHECVRYFTGIKLRLVIMWSIMPYSIACCGLMM